MSTVKATTWKERMSEWRERLAGTNAPQVRALDLYSGGSWSIIRKVHSGSSFSENVRLWVISAGHGVLTPDSFIPPYSATFTRNEADYVLGSKEKHQVLKAWWQELIKPNRIKSTVSVSTHSCSSLSAIARTFPNEPLIVAVSLDYLAAIEEDLLEARDQLASMEHLILICSGSNKEGAFRNNFLPFDSRFEHHVGRSRTALNAKLLRLVLEENSTSEIKAGELAKKYARLSSTLPPSTYPIRTPATDEKIMKFIRRELVRKANGSHTGLLRLYRSRGLACEQGRFRTLFKRVKRNHPSGIIHAAKK